MVQECTLTVAQSQKRQVIQSAIDGYITNQQAAGALSLSVRQVQRLKGKVRHDGPAGIRHGNAGKEPANKLPEDLRQKMLDLAADTYAQYNFSHMTDALPEDEGIIVSDKNLPRL